MEEVLELVKSWDWKVISPIVAAITGFSSIIIALCALVFTFWQGRIARRYNRLSVMPYLIPTASFEEKTAGHYSIGIINNGIGPAMIQSYSVHLDGQPIEGTGPEPIHKILRNLFPNSKFASTHQTMTPNYMMRAKENVPLMDIQFRGESFPNKIAVAQALNKIRIIIAYKSIYGEEQILDTSPPSSLSKVV